MGKISNCKSNFGQVKHSNCKSNILSYQQKFSVYGVVWCDSTTIQIGQRHL